MKLWTLGVGLAGLAAALFPEDEKDQPWVFVLSGDTAGYLSPCGCTDPMSGGVKRRATAIRNLSVKDRTIILENGGFVATVGRQDELKVETMAQIMGALEVTAVNFAPSDAKLGPGAMHSINRLSGEKLISASLAASSTNPLPPSVVSGQFLIGGVTSQPELIAASLGEKSVPLDRAVSALVREAEEAKLFPILLLQGTRDEAVALAKKYPRLRLIQYRSSGTPPSSIERVGTTVLATPGEKGRHVVRLTFSEGRFETYSPVELSPGYKDDPHISDIYGAYLKRVGEERLLEKLPRMKTAEFAGTEECGRCHRDAMKIWEASKHAIALNTLEREGHSRDPDCVSCHVVGLSSQHGFTDRENTPNLAHVGCESCHGPGKAHSDAPTENKLGPVGKDACMTCHTSQNSPKFDYNVYWSKIKH